GSVVALGLAGLGRLRDRLANGRGGDSKQRYRNGQGALTELHQHHQWEPFGKDERGNGSRQFNPALE
ncbi:UNVERIFIED_CONTAM: hypothetical protein PVV41_26575, partial [Salmonella enterica subsp. enterica serovar Typhimurium]